jgi:regulatory protein
MRPPAPPPGPPPDAAALRQAALNHLARYGTTQAGLLRVLTRRIQRWARAAEAPGESVTAAVAAARAVVAQLTAIGALDDARFAESRVRSLQRAGRSRRAISAHLQAKGVPAELAAVPEDPAAELAAALLYARRRRIGPFRPEPDPDLRPRDLARMARAGFTAAAANQALDLPADEAEALVAQARRQ